MLQHTETKLNDYIDGLIATKSPSVICNSIKSVTQWIDKQNDIDYINKIFESNLSIKMTNLISHESESVRESALHFLIKIIIIINSKLNMNYMKVLIPVISGKLGVINDEKIMNDDKIYHESSEEIRRLIVQLLNKIICNNYEKFQSFCTKNEADYCAQYMNILHLLFNDNCPQIRILICQMLLDQINKYQEDKYEYDKENKSILFEYLFNDYAEYLCLALSKGCKHQRGKIRLISFELISKIIEENIKITNNISKWITDHNKIWKFIFDLSFDQTEFIKKSITNNAFKWIKILNGVNHENKDKKYSKMQYAKIWILMLNDNGLNILKQEKFEFDLIKELLSSIDCIITLCTQQINHWLISHRLFGIKSLVSFTLCLKQQFPSKYFINLLPNFINLIESQNENIKIEINKCLKLFGQFIPIKDYSKFLFSKFECDESIKSYLKICNQIFIGYQMENMNENYVFQICQSLSNATLQQNVSIEIMNATNSLLSVCDQSLLNSQSIFQILWLIIQIHGKYLKDNHQKLSLLTIDIKNEKLNEKIINVLKLLTDDENIWHQHFKYLYQNINKNKWNKEYSYYLFAALMNYTKQFIGKYINIFLSVFDEINNAKKSEENRYALLSILYCLLQNIQDSKDWNQYTEKIIIEILLPNIVWKPGKFRLKMRLLSLQSMVLLYQQKCINCSVTWNHREKLISSLKSRFDDFEENTRKYTVQLFKYILKHLYRYKQYKGDDNMNLIKKSELESLCGHILDRFEDSNDEIRIITCSTLISFIKCLNKTKNINIYSKIIKTALIHLDDENKNVQKVIFELLKRLSVFNKQEFDKQINKININNVQQSSSILMRQLLTN